MLCGCYMKYPSLSSTHCMRSGGGLYDSVFLKQYNRVRRNPKAFTGKTESFFRGRLDADAVGRNIENSGDRFDHARNKRHQLGTLRQDRAVQIDDEIMVRGIVSRYRRAQPRRASHPSARATVRRRRNGRADLFHMKSPHRRESVFFLQPGGERHSRVRFSQVLSPLL